MKISLSICIMALCMGLLTACTAESPNSQALAGAKQTEGSDAPAQGSEPQARENGPGAVDVNIGVIKGPTAIGMVKFMAEADGGEIDSNNYSFVISASVDEIVPKIVQGEIDIAAVLPNLSSVLYHNTQGKVQVLAINTLGMISIVETGDTISSVEDLRGKTIFASGKGGPLEFALNYILRSNGIDPERDLNIEWKSEHTEVVTSLLTGTTSIALLPQPFVTTAQMSDENVRIAIDLNEEWDRIQETAEAPSALIMGVYIVRTDFAAQNPEATADFLDRYAASVRYVNSNLNEAAALVGQYDIFPEAVAQRAIPHCNISFIEGREMREKLSGYLQVLLGQEPQSVGGSLPGDDFYFSR